MQRRTFFAGTAAATGVALVANRAEAAASSPGCFPATPFASPFVNARSDKNAVLAVGTWNLIANGRIFKFFVTKVVGSKVSASLSSGDTVNVRWDPVAKKLSFTRRTSDGKGGLTDQDFTGFLMDVNPDDDKLRVAGFVTREPPPKTNYDHPKRLTYAWYMTKDR